MRVTQPNAMYDRALPKLLKAASWDCTIEEMCSYAEISKQTYYNWLESFPELKERFEHARQVPVLTSRETVIKDLVKPDTAKWYLERKKKDEFAQRQETTGKGGEALSVTMFIPKPHDSDE